VMGRGDFNAALFDCATAFRVRSLSNATRSAFTIIVHQSFVLSRYGQVRWQDCWVDIEDPYHIVVQGKVELVSALLHWGICEAISNSVDHRTLLDRACCYVATPC